MRAISSTSRRERICTRSPAVSGSHQSPTKLILSALAVASLATAAPDSASDYGAEVSPENDVNYTCNEGITLTVRYRNEGPDFVAYVAYDDIGSEVRLVQVPSGSGNEFQSGSYSMFSKGSELMLDFDGGTDICHETN